MRNYRDRFLHKLNKPENEYKNKDYFIKYFVVDFVFEERNADILPKYYDE